MTYCVSRSKYARQIPFCLHFSENFLTLKLGLICLSVLLLFVCTVYIIVCCLLRSPVDAAAISSSSKSSIRSLRENIVNVQVCFMLSKQYCCITLADYAFAFLLSYY